MKALCGCFVTRGIVVRCSAHKQRDRSPRELAEWNRSLELSAHRRDCRTCLDGGVRACPEGRRRLDLVIAARAAVRRAQAA